MDDGILIVVGLALLPALGNLGGGMLAEWLQPSQKIVNLALHAAAGIIVAVISIEVMPQALRGASTWLLALAFLTGGGTHLLIESGIDRWQAIRASGVGTGAWMTYVAVATDLVGDGLLIGTASSVSSKIALLLAAGQVLADIPEGFAVIANFRERGVGRIKRLMLSVSFVIPVVGAALISYFLLREQSQSVKMGGLVFVAGIYILAVFEDMLREAHESAEDSRWSAISFLIGFALFLVVSGSSV